jgi:uracil phosphoribosyltransferase
VVSTVHVSQHPLLLDKLARLRDQATEPPLFRTLVHDLTQILFLEFAATLRLGPITVRTPLGECAGQVLVDRVALVPVLRAGLGMADAILALLPSASVWHLGLYRDHETCLPVTYYNKLPAALESEVVLVLDPMLATGGSAVETIHLLKRCHVGRIAFLALIAAPEGVAQLHKVHPEVPIYLAALDSHLNEKKYIVPGLGDAGDRQFGTS